MGRKTISRQLEHCLHEKIAFGESRHAAKIELKGQLGDDYRFGLSDKKIHSIATFNTYQKVAKEYSRWLIEIKGLNKYTNMAKTEQYAKEYLQYRLDNEKSLWTVKMERSALSKIYGCTIEILTRPPSLGHAKRKVFSLFHSFACFYWFFSNREPF